MHACGRAYKTGSAGLARDLWLTTLSSCPLMVSRASSARGQAHMSFLFDSSYYEVRKSGISPAQNMAAYLGGSAIQTVGDNPVTAYRQLVQQFAKDAAGNAVDPKVASSEANAVFLRSPVAASLSGLWPRMIGGACLFPICLPLFRRPENHPGRVRTAHIRAPLRCRIFSPPSQHTAWRAAVCSVPRAPRRSLPLS